MHDGAEEVEHEFADGRGGVGAFLKAGQLNPAGLEAIHGKEYDNAAPHTLGQVNRAGNSGDCFV